jgi:hypothetical protein
MRTGPQGAKRPEPQGDQRERDRRPAARPQRERRPMSSRRLRRARHPAGRSGGPGLISAGADVNAVQRSGTERTTATAGSMPAAFRAAFLPRTPPPGPTATHRTGTQWREEADGVTAARRWRDVCRLVPRCCERERTAHFPAVGQSTKTSCPFI